MIELSPVFPRNLTGCVGQMILGNSFRGNSAFGK
jgi:hypothetical protein